MVRGWKRSSTDCQQFIRRRRVHTKLWQTTTCIRPATATPQSCTPHLQRGELSAQDELRGCARQPPKLRRRDVVLLYLRQEGVSKQGAWPSEGRRSACSPPLLAAVECHPCSKPALRRRARTQLAASSTHLACQVEAGEQQLLGVVLQAAVADVDALEVRQCSAQHPPWQP